MFILGLSDRICAVGSQRLTEVSVGCDLLFGWLSLDALASVPVVVGVRDPVDVASISNGLTLA